MTRRVGGAIVATGPLVLVLVLALAHPLAGQIPGLKGAGSTTTSQERPPDPLGRTTPRGTIEGFIRAADRNDYTLAASYLQVAESQRQNASTLARSLSTLMNRFLVEPVMRISDSPDGQLDDDLPFDRERVGPLTVGGKKIDVVLVHVTDPSAGRIWLISSETVAQVPALNRTIARTWIERVMPAALVSSELFDISLAHWIVFLALLVVLPIAVALVGAAGAVIVRRLVGPSRRYTVDQWYDATRWPVITVIALAIHLSSLRILGYPIAFRITWAHLVRIIAVIAVAMLLRRLLALGFARARALAWGKDRMSTRSLMLLGERVMKVLVVVLAILAVLTIVGVNTRTALAGLGIGGVALALGAQKTVENFLGGVFLLSDRVLAVGDVCNISNRVGTVEDITLRSVRLRTLDQTLVSVPAGMLDQAGIENFASREKILTQSLLRLRYGTSVDQLTEILDHVRYLLTTDPKIEKESARIRLINFGERAIELELFAYFLTADYAEFLALREALLLQSAKIVEAAGSAFAQPTEFIYMDGKPPEDARASLAARRTSGPDDRRMPSAGVRSADDMAG